LPALKRLENGSELQKIPVLEGPGKDVKILPAKIAGKASFDAERLYGVPEYEFVGDYIRGDPPRGRKAILSQAIDALQGGEKLVVLTGQGGIGKTVLAAEAARRLSWRYPGGVFWRSAADMERLGLNELLDAFAEVLGWEFRTLPLDAKRDRALNYLRNFDTASLLVVDNAEKIHDSNLWQFLESIPEPSAALVTMRESLPREGKEIRVVDMEIEEASRLFIIEARRRFPKWGENLNEDEMNSLSEISSIMQGHPLAIKLTAALVASRSLASIRDELRRNPPQEVLDRFDVSYTDLTESQKRLLGCLAVFSSSVTEDAIKSVCIKEETDSASNCETDLGELVRKSFLDRVEIEVQDEAGKDAMLYRYRMHPLMRQYAGAKAERDLLIKLRERAANYFLGYAQNFSKDFDMMEMEKENILSGMNWAVSKRDSSTGEEKKNLSRMVLRFMSSLYNFLDTRGYWNEYGSSLQQAIESAVVLGDRRELAGWVHNLGILAQKRGDYIEARKLYQQSMKIKQELGDKSGVSKSLHQMGRLAQDTGEYNKARKLYQQSLKIKQELGDKSGVSKSLGQMGRLAQDTGEYEEARKLYQQSLKILQELGDKSGVSISLHQMGWLAQVTSEYDEARKLYQQSLKILQELGDKIGVSSSLHHMGMLAQATGEYGEARKLYQQSLKIMQEVGDKSGIASSQAQMALLEEKMGNVKDALRMIRLAEAAFLELGSPYSQQAQKDRERLEKNQ
jgi:predicted ATPase/Tfp pilus assembly protein PilF